jgi:hypothetical protein
MTTKLSPIESEFATEAEAAEYQQWFAARVNKAIDDKQPRVPHDKVMADLRELLANKGKAA